MKSGFSRWYLDSRYHLENHSSQRPLYADQLSMAITNCLFSNNNDRFKRGMGWQRNQKTLRKIEHDISIYRVAANLELFPILVYEDLGRN